MLKLYRTWTLKFTSYPPVHKVLHRMKYIEFNLMSTHSEWKYWCADDCWKYVQDIYTLLAKKLKMFAIHKDVHENKDTFGN